MAAMTREHQIDLFDRPELPAAPPAIAADIQAPVPRPHRVPVRCPKCRSADFREHPIHGGRSTRRDCGRCKATLGFPFWYGKRQPIGAANGGYVCAGGGG